MVLIKHEHADTGIRSHNNYGTHGKRYHHGLLKVDEEEYSKLDRQYILRTKKESYGYSCLTNQKQYYAENYPQIAIEKGNIDEVITMMIRGVE